MQLTSLIIPQELKKSEEISQEFRQSSPRSRRKRKDAVSGDGFKAESRYVAGLSKKGDETSWKIEI